MHVFLTIIENIWYKIQCYNSKKGVIIIKKGGHDNAGATRLWWIN